MQAPLRKQECFLLQFSHCHCPGRAMQAIILNGDASKMLPARRSRPNGNAALGALSVLAAAAIILPILVLGFRAVIGDLTHWSHLWSTILPELAINSVLLCVLVAFGVVLAGALPAWLVAQFDFPGRRWLEWLLVLPLAVPAYVMAYAYTDALQYAGPLQSLMRDIFGWQSRLDYWFPEIRSLWGAALVLTLALYPYVYVLSRVAFLEQSASLTEAGRSAGLTRWQVFWRVSLPVGRPAIAAGATLALMETLADFGTVSFFGVPTFTTAIFKTWFSQGQLAIAAQLAGVLLMAALLLLWLEHRLRNRARYHQHSTRTHHRARIHSTKRWAATILCALPFGAGFLLPVLILVRLAWRESATAGSDFLALAANSALVAGLGACLIVAMATVMAFAARSPTARIPRHANRIASTGYALPGLVVAAGLTVTLVAADRALADLLGAVTGRSMPLLFSGTVAILIYAYFARFLGVALQAVEAGLAKITPRLEDAARSLGASPRATLLRVHAPMLQGSVTMAALLVFVDVVKELPATLVMRPFNFDTLAVRAYTLAMDERLGEAALPALAIIAVALPAVLAASRSLAGARSSAPV
jgi:iron(III) transport system permease protein